MRVTKSMLEERIKELNELTSSPLTPYTRNEETKRTTANIGNYHLSQAYGGYCVHRMHNEGGAVTTPITHGHVTKRELFEKLCSFIEGIELGKTF